MQPTTTGTNRTGAATSPEGVQAMANAVMTYSPPAGIDTSESEDDRALYAADAEPIGSIPPPTSLKGSLKSGLDKLMGERPELLMDKIGERIAFERGGTRLYDALIAKHKATRQTGTDLPPLSEAIATAGIDPSSLNGHENEDALATLMRIRDEELSHFQMLCEAMEKLGGDPTAQTPCADVTATAAAGLIQVVTDPRTTLAQAFNAILVAELTDNAGWELLIQLTEQAGEDDLAERFRTALLQEAQHLLAVRQWLRALLMANTTTQLV